mgnify:CR=1 FL=1
MEYVPHSDETAYWEGLVDTPFPSGYEAEDEEANAESLITSADCWPHEREYYFEVLAATQEQLDAFRTDSTLEFADRICGYVPNELQKRFNLGAFTDQQLAIWDSVDKYANTMVFSGNGIGKTIGLAILATRYLCNGYKVITTAPVKRQVANLWSEIRTIREQALNVRGLRLPGRWAPRAHEVELSPKWTMRGYTARVQAGEQVATAFAGEHHSKTMVVMDEFVGVPEPVWEAADRLLTDENAKFVGAGNPTDPTSYAAKAAKMKDPATGLPLFNVLHLSSEDHPNVKFGMDIIPGATSRKFCAKQLAKGGSRDSAYYRTSVLGLFPNQAEDALIRSEWIEAAKLRGELRYEDSKLPPKQRKFPKDHRGVALGLDVAGEGKDLTVLMGCEGGKLFYPKLRDPQGDTLPCWHRGRDHTHATELLVQGILQIPRVMSVCIDDTGLGAAVAAELWRRAPKEFPEVPIYITKGRFATPDEQYMRVSVQRLNFANKPPKGDDEIFDSMKAFLWWKLREALRENRVHLPCDTEQRAANFPEESDLFAQLLAPIYTSAGGKLISVYDKASSYGGKGKELSKHLPTASPDQAHSAMLAWSAWAVMPERIAAPETPIEVFAARKDAMIAAATPKPSGFNEGRRPFQRRAR